MSSLNCLFTNKNSYKLDYYVLIDSEYSLSIKNYYKIVLELLLNSDFSNNSVYLRLRNLMLSVLVASIIQGNGKLFLSIWLY